MWTQGGKEDHFYHQYPSVQCIFHCSYVCSNTHPFGKSLLSPPGHPVSQPQVCPWVCFPLALAAKIFQDLWYHFGVARQPHTTLARFPYLGQIVLYYLLKGLENFLSISQNIIHFKPFSKLHRTVSLRHGGLGNVRWCSLATSKWQLRSYNTISFDSLISSCLAFFSLVKVVMSVLVKTLLLYLGFNPPTHPQLVFFMLPATFALTQGDPLHRVPLP